MYADGVDRLVFQGDAGHLPVCDTVPVNSTWPAGRWNAGFTAPWRVMRGAAVSPAGLTRWSWIADAVLALALAVGALQGALNRPADELPFRPPIGDRPPPPDLPYPPDGPKPPGVDTVVQHYGGLHWWTVVLAVMTALPLVARRRYPLTVFWVVIAASLLYHDTPGYDAAFTFTACVIAAYSAAVYSPHQVAALVSLVAGGAFVVADDKASMPAIGPGVATLPALMLIVFGANALHNWRQRLRRLEEQQKAATQQAVERERARIAQELHDVVTHNVSMMVVQTGAARKVMTAAPDRAEQALLAVESGGRAALTELRHVMGLLTMNGDDPQQLHDEDLTPPPGLGQVEALAERVRETGATVDLTVTGTPVPLPPGMDLAAYRVLQEALTNTVKHASGAHVEITIDHGPHVLLLEVTDSGGFPAAPARSGNGRGLIGMQQRLAVYGGTLEAGERPLGGYRVRARIPLDGV
jgi:signal transduction histidine kinase